MNTLVISLAFACVGTLLAWLLRRPTRRLAGAGPAFCLWLLPLLLAAVAWLPAWNVTTPGATSLLTLPPILVEPQVPAATTHSTLHIVPIVFALWLAGCGVMLVRLALHGWRITHHSRPLPPALRKAVKPHSAGIKAHDIRQHPAGPAVFWLPGYRLLLPQDLLQRFNDEQLAQVIAHERMHLARRDPMWSLTAELTLAALWFFPPAWLAIDRFRLDQELACDAAILRHAPRHAGVYARALLSSATTSRTLTATTPWLTQSQLKERLTMIQHHPRTRLQRPIGYAALITMLAGTALAAHAAVPAPNHADTAGAMTSQTTPSAATHQGTQTATVRMSYRRRHPPHYPVKAIKKHEQGTVVLLVLVSAEGRPLTIKVDKKRTTAPAILYAPAMKAAAGWKFNPRLENGKAVPGWARIPVRFSLNKKKTKNQVSANASGNH